MSCVLNRSYCINPSTSLITKYFIAKNVGIAHISINQPTRSHSAIVKAAMITENRAIIVKGIENIICLPYKFNHNFAFLPPNEAINNNKAAYFIGLSIVIIKIIIPDIPRNNPQTIIVNIM